MKFIDLFAGLGGFHLALSRLGHECVFSCEIDKKLNDLYQSNFNMKPHYDITNLDINTIPDFDILCAGFPCQPFSIAGKHLGFLDHRGNLFDHIANIIYKYQPKYLILENVSNLLHHDKGKTWGRIHDILVNDLEYEIKYDIISPIDIGIAQDRKRIFIVGARKDIGLSHFNFSFKKKKKININDFILDNKEIKGIKRATKEQKEALAVWQLFLNSIPSDKELTNSMLLPEEWGATYPINGINLDSEEIKGYRGKFGVELKGMNKDELIMNLPDYSLKHIGKWKSDIIRMNRTFYEDNKNYLFEFYEKLKELKMVSLQKLEWQVGKSLDRNIYNYNIQFRSSIRVKKLKHFPCITTIASQVPYLPSHDRFLSIEEMLLLQSYPVDFKLPEK
jgi:DNA (cytosine-5)-methyltransferase 1